jgi:tetratricopeptide (TPR) repeat protein
MFFGEYALFFADVADDQERAQEMFERALDEAPEHTNTIGNFARLLFEQGEWEQAISAADRALSLAKDSEVELILEVNFYLAALGPMERFGESLSEVRRLIEDGVRSSEWTLDRVLARASAERREDIEWLRVLAEVINEVRSPEVLNGWQAWREARLRPQ